jgi:hypothetical protein
LERVWSNLKEELKEELDARCKDEKSTEGKTCKKVKKEASKKRLHCGNGDAKELSRK